MQYQWDPVKADRNLQKHGIPFSDAVIVFADEQAITIIDDEHSQEQRYITLGMDAFGRILVVVYIYRGSIIRIISARKATPRERQQYQEGDK